MIQTGLSEYWPTDQRGERWTYEFDGVRGQIDHILISQSIRDACGRSGIDPSVVDPADAEVSDHRALVLDLEFR